MLALQGRTPAQPRPKSHSDGAEASAPSALHKGSALTLCHHHVMPPGLPVDTCPNFQTNWWAEELCSRSPGLAFGGCSAINRCTSWGQSVNSFPQATGSAKKDLEPRPTKARGTLRLAAPQLPGRRPLCPSWPASHSFRTVAVLLLPWPCVFSLLVFLQPSLQTSLHSLNTASPVLFLCFSLHAPPWTTPSSRHCRNAPRSPGLESLTRVRALATRVSDLTSSPKVASLCWPISSSGPY